MKKYRLAIVGATGLVGREFAMLVETRQFPAESVEYFASEGSAGSKIMTASGEKVVRAGTPEALRDIEVAVFATGPEIAKYLAPAVAGAGGLVVDTSPAFRSDESVPLVIPEINPQDIEHHRGIIANPNCSTIQLALVLNPLHKVNRIKRVIVSTYQSVSGIGGAGVDELIKQTRAALDGKTLIPHAFPHRIAFNVLPEVDVFLGNGYTREEFKIMEETRRVLHDNQIAISATCARVPVHIGHCQSVNIDLTSPISPEEARKILMSAPGVKVLDDPSINLYPQPWTVAGMDDILVGRVRQDQANPAGLAMWVAADNLRKGTALNAIQILEESIRRGRL